MANHYIPLPSGMIMQVGDSAFTTTGTTKTIATQLKKIVMCHVTETVAYASTDLMYGSKTISAGLVTITRAAGTTNGLTFDYMFIGY